MGSLSNPAEPGPKNRADAITPRWRAEATPGIARMQPIADVVTTAL